MQTKCWAHLHPSRHHPQLSCLHRLFRRVCAYRPKKKIQEKIKGESQNSTSGPVRFTRHGYRRTLPALVAADDSDSR